MRSRLPSGVMHSRLPSGVMRSRLPSGLMRSSEAEGRSEVRKVGAVGACVLPERTMRRRGGGAIKKKGEPPLEPEFEREPLTSQYAHRMYRGACPAGVRSTDVPTYDRSCPPVERPPALFQACVSCRRASPGRRSLLTQFQYIDITSVRTTRVIYTLVSMNATPSGPVAQAATD